MSNPIQILLIEDDPADARLLAEMLADLRAEGLSFDLAWSKTLESGQQRLGDAGIDVVLLDLGLPGSTGLPTLLRLLAGGPCRPALLVLSGLVDDEVAIQALRAGAQDYLVKGEVDAPHLARAIRHAISRAQAEQSAREQAADLVAAKDRAEASNQAKSHFLASISHELRTPLNGILGFAQLLQVDSDLSVRQRRSADMIRMSGEHLLALINDILDLAKVEAGRLELNPREFELAAMLRTVVDIIRVKAAHKPGLALAFELAPDLPTHIQADEQRLRQVLLNLLDNAVKFTEAGAVTLRLLVSGPARLHCEVDDTGTGLTEAQRAGLFRPFEQAGERAQRCQGTGLGLVISRQLVRLMGGDLQVEARPGGGNRFGFDIDLAAAVAA